MSKRTVVVIGGGPGGYVAALRLAQLGAAVTLVEKDTLGGTCLNRGCIPTKVLLHTAELYEEIRDGRPLGLVADNCRVDWAALMKRKDAVITRLTGGVGALMQRRGVRVVKGQATFTGPTEIRISEPNGAASVMTADAFLIATGSEPTVPPVPGFDLPGIATSTEALAFDPLPRSLVVVGGGVIGVELASVYATLGTRVTIIEALPGILANLDDEVIPIVLARLKTLGIAVHAGVSVARVEPAADGYAVTVGGAAPFAVTAEKVLVCTGRRPATDGLGLDKTGIALERRRIAVDRRHRTNVAHIHAIGDCASPVMLAHVASHQGIAAAEAIMGLPDKADGAAVPGAIYTRPEIGWVGLTEKEAVAKGFAVKVGRFPLAGNGKSLIMNETEGLVKIVAGARHGEILGVHIVGPRATDLIAEAGLALTLEATVEELIATIHAHPTVSEAMAEAALAVVGRPLHML